MEVATGTGSGGRRRTRARGRASAGCCQRSRDRTAAGGVTRAVPDEAAGARDTSGATPLPCRPVPFPGNSRRPAVGAHPRAPAHSGRAARGIRGEGAPGQTARAATYKIVPCPQSFRRDDGDFRQPVSGSGYAGSGTCPGITTRGCPLSRALVRIEDTALCEKSPGTPDDRRLAITGRFFEAAIATYTPQVERWEDARPAIPQRTQAACTPGA